jgi:hypothetical protein
MNGFVPLPVDAMPVSCVSRVAIAQRHRGACCASVMPTTRQCEPRPRGSSRQQRRRPRSRIEGYSVRLMSSLTPIGFAKCCRSPRHVHAVAGGSASCCGSMTSTMRLSGPTESPLAWALWSTSRSGSKTSWKARRRRLAALEAIASATLPCRPRRCSR